jgi:hypothetical protein
VGHAGEVAAGPRVTDGELDRAAGECPSGDVDLAPAIAAQDEEALPRSDQQLRLGSAGHRAYDLDAVRARDGRGAVHAFASEEHRDVLTDTSSIVKGPAAQGRVRPLQLPQDLGDRSALDDHLSVALGEFAQGRAQSDDRHRPESRGGTGWKGVLLPADRELVKAPGQGRRRCASGGIMAVGGRRSPMRIEMPESRFADLDGPVHFVEWDGRRGRSCCARARRTLPRGSPSPRPGEARTVLAPISPASVAATGKPRA